MTLLHYSICNHRQLLYKQQKDTCQRKRVFYAISQRWFRIWLVAIRPKALPEPMLIKFYEDHFATMSLQNQQL